MNAHSYQVIPISYLPGRARLDFPFIRNNTSLAQKIEEQLLEMDAVEQVEANPVSGRVLIHFDPQNMPQKVIFTHSTLDFTLFFTPLTDSIPGKDLDNNMPNTSLAANDTETPFLATILGQASIVAITGGLFIYTVITKIFLGQTGNPLSATSLTQSGLQIISGYPVLRKQAEKIPRIGSLSGPAFITVTTLIIATINKNPLGLFLSLALGLSTFTNANIMGRMAKKRAELIPASSSAARLKSSEIKAREWLQLPGDLPELEDYARQMTFIAFGTASLIFIFTGNIFKSLAVLLIANPRPAYTSATVSMAALIDNISSRGIIIREPETIARLARIEQVVLEAPGIITAAKPSITKIISYDSRYTQESIARYAYTSLQDLNLPLTQALASWAKQKNIAIHDNSIRTLCGNKGVICVIEGIEIIVGTLGFLRTKKISTRAAQTHIAGFNLVHHDIYGVAINNQLAGLIAVNEDLVPDATIAIEKIRLLGIPHISVLSENCPSYLADDLCLTTLDAPADPKSILVACTAGSLPALQKDCLSLAVKDADRPVKEAADLIITGSWSDELPLLIDTAKIMREITKQNVLLSRGAGLIGILLAVSGYIPFTGALVVNEVINLLVALNSSRLFYVNMASTQAGSGRAMPVGPLKDYLSGQYAVQSGKSKVEFAVGLEYPLKPVLPETLLPHPGDHGLTYPEIQARLKLYGYNQLEKAPVPGWFELFRNQFQDVASLTLMGAGGIAALLGHLTDTLTILSILVMNAALGASQEYKAERSIQAMQRLVAPRARVFRDGEVQFIDTSQLVPGDCLLLEAGDKVPADAVVVTADDLLVEESMLTGEAEPVPKKAFSYMAAKTIEMDLTEQAVAQENLALDSRMVPAQSSLKNSESPCFIYMGTHIIRGKCRAIVSATGMNSQMGQILSLVQSGKPEISPLQSSYHQVTKFLIYGSIVSAGVVAIMGLFTGRGTPLQMIMTGLSMAVAAIPEGLPAIVNIAHSKGVQRLAKQGALVRRLSAMETLGRISIVCTDKTGTVTSGHISLQAICTYNEQIDVNNISSLYGSRDALWALTIGMICNDGIADFSGKFTGDAVDIALLETGARLGLFKDTLDLKYSRIFSIPFESDRGYMAILSKGSDGYNYLFMKGAPEKVIDSCIRYRQGEQEKPLDDLIRAEFIKRCDLMASDGFKVIGVAYRRDQPITLNDSTLDNQGIAENELVFAGLIGMMDQLRPGVAAAVKKCKDAGLKVMMITGDHPKTACAIAKLAGILDEGGLVITGNELDDLTDKILDSISGSIQVFARVKPANKLRIVSSLRRMGHAVIMTGDGVNDSPAVKWADAGIAMGTGTEVTKEASAIILVDDGFTTILKALEEGRNININVKSALEFLIAGNSGEVLLMALAILCGLPLPLLPLHILLVNLFTDGLPALGIALRRPSGTDILKRSTVNQNIEADRAFYPRVVSRGTITGLSTLLTYFLALRTGADLGKARTIAFASIVGSQFGQLFHWPSLGITRANWVQSDAQVRNMLGISWLGLLSSIYVPVLRNIFGFTPLSLGDWGFILIPAASSTGIASYYDKWIENRMLLPQNNIEKGGDHTCRVTDKVF